MKTRFLLILLLFWPVGCTLIPKRVEYFQDKVQAVPELSERGEEFLRQAAQLAEKKADETHKAAIETKADTSVVEPAGETKILTSAVSETLGPPAKDYEGEVLVLVAQLQKEVARLNAKLDAYADKVDENVGKKIEGTGAIQVSYMTNLLIIGLVVVLAGMGLKILMTAYAPVNIAGKAVYGGAKVIAKGLGEVVQAGQEFKNRVQDEITDPDTARQIIKIFTEAQRANQSSDTQTIVKTIKPDRL